MPPWSSGPAVPADAPAVAAVVIANEIAYYGATTFSVADLEEEWTDLDVARDTRVYRDGDRLVGYGVVKDRGEVAVVEGYVHPDACGRGIGRQIVTDLEAASAGCARIQNGTLEADAAARALLESLGYVQNRVFREMRILLDAPPAAPVWPEGLRAETFDAERDARAFCDAHQEAFADMWGFTPRSFEEWTQRQLEGERADPSLWCVVRDGDEIAAGTISTPDTYGGGYIHVVFTRRPWRGRGVGAALLADAFGRFWERGERNIGLGVDAQSETGAFRLYERVGMTPFLGWVTFEKRLVS